jgi:hypothetical protein
MQPRCRTTEMQLLRHRNEIAELPELDRRLHDEILNCRRPVANPRYSGSTIRRTASAMAVR